MSHIALFFRRCHLFHKRFYFKKGFLALLLLIPCIGLAFGITAEMDSGIMTVALASEDDDPTALSLIEALLSDPGVVRFRETASPEEAISLVTHGKADTAWVFVADLTKTCERFAEKQSSHNALVYCYGRENGVLQALLREKLCGALYPYLSEQRYLHFVRNTLADAEIPVPDTDILMGYYEAEAPEGAELFDYHFTDTATGAGGAVLKAPLRGLLSVTVVLGAIAVSMFYKTDREKGVFTGFSPSSMPPLTFGYHMSAVLDIGLAMLLSLYGAGVPSQLGTELLYLLLFCIAASLFAMVLERLFRSLSLYAALTPLLILGMTVLCPVFFTLPSLGILPYLFPPYYYIMGTSGAMSPLPLLLYIALLGITYAATVFISKRRGDVL